MGFMSELKKAANGEESGDCFVINGKPLVCSHCGGDHFLQSYAQLNTAFMTFLNLDWANAQVSIYECTRCGHIEWFRK